MKQKIVRIMWLKKFWNKFNNSHSLKFLFVGGLNTAVGYGIFAGLVLLNAHYIAASLIGHMAGVTNSYFWNKYFTFRAPEKDYPEVLRFIGVYTVHYAVSLGGLVLLVEIFNFYPLIGQALVLVVTTVISFLGHKYFTFRHALSQGKPYSKA